MEWEVGLGQYIAVIMGNGKTRQKSRGGKGSPVAAGEEKEAKRREGAKSEGDQPMIVNRTLAKGNGKTLVNNQPKERRNERVLGGLDWNLGMPDGDPEVSM